VELSKLTRDLITNWRNKIADAPRTVRGKKDMPARALPAPKNDEETRRRRSTANRTLTVLRAALNQAFREGKADSDVAWRTAKPFREVEAARIHYFSVEESRRLMNAAQGHFRELVKAALFTGCRYGELTRLRVRDFNGDAGTVFVAKSKSGKARYVVLTEEGQKFFKSLSARHDASELLLAKEDGESWGASHQLRPMREACQAARLKPVGFHVLRHTYASLLAMAGAPLNVIAQNLGHADTRMCERHYAHLAPNYVASMIRQFSPVLGAIDDEEEDNLVPFAAGAGNGGESL
jgi:integrase